MISVENLNLTEQEAELQFLKYYKIHFNLYFVLMTYGN